MSASSRALLIIFLTVFIDLLGFGIVLPLLAVFGEKLGVTGLELGLLTGIFPAMQFLAAPYWGQLSDRMGRRPILLLGLVGSLTCYLLYAYGSAIGSFWLLLAARCGAGIAGATLPTAQAFIADVTPVEQRTRGMAVFGAAFGMGFTFGPVIGGIGFILDPFAHTEAVLSPMPGLLAATMSGFALGLAFFLLPETRPPEQTPAPAGPGSAKRAPTAGRSRWQVLQDVRQRPVLWRIIFAFFVASLGFAMFETTLSLLAAGAFRLSEERIYGLFFLTGLILSFAQGFLVRKLSQWYADELMAQRGILLMSGGMILLMIAVYTQHWLYALGFALLLLGILSLVTGFAFLTSPTQSMVSRRCNTTEQGAVLGVNQSAAALARILGQSFGVVFLEWWIYLPYLLAIAFLAIAWWLLRQADAAATKLASQQLHSREATTAAVSSDQPPALEQVIAATDR